MTTKTVRVANHPDLVPIEEAADLLGVTPASLNRMAREDRGPRRARFGPRVYYSRQSIDAYIERKLSEDGRGELVEA